jgi:hypothetical protein
VFPEQAFESGVSYQVPFAILLFALFLIFTLGQRWVVGYYRNPYVVVLAASEVEEFIQTWLPGAPEAAKERFRERRTRFLIGSEDPLPTAAGIVGSGVLFVFFIFELWFLHSILARFAGGQEEAPVKGRIRPSLFLLAYAFFPLALRKFFEGLIMFLSDPRAASNVLSLDGFRWASRVSFSPASLLPRSFLEGLAGSYLETATDPFFVWTIFIILWGGRSILRVSLRSAALQVGVLFLLWAAQNYLFRSLNLSWGVLV